MNTVSIPGTAFSPTNLRLPAAYWEWLSLQGTHEFKVKLLPVPPVVIETDRQAQRRAQRRQRRKRR